MKFNIRWQLLLATVAFGLVLSLLSFQAQSVGLCSINVPAAGGAFIEGIVGKPLGINPLFSDNLPVDRELVNLLFDGLTRFDSNGLLVPALAESWSVSEDGLVVNFKLKQDVKWHDGEAFTAKDVAFTYGLMQDPQFSGQQALKTLWQAVSIDTVGDYEIEFTLPEPYAPFLDATTRGILPAHVWQGLDLLGMSSGELNVAPVGTGPFMVNPGQDWQRSGRIRLSPNPLYWPKRSQISILEFRFYPDDETLAAAFLSGEVHAVNTVSDSTLPLLASAAGTRLFTSPTSKYTELLFNVSESASPAVQSAESRRAFVNAVDRQKLIDDNLEGQGLPMDGPFLPSSWAYNANLSTDYFQRPISATQLLDSEGWIRPEGETWRMRDGDPLSLRLVTSGSALHSGLADAIAAQWRQVGIQVELSKILDLAELRETLSERAFDVAIVDIAPPGDPDLYDFWSQEATIRGQGYSGWNNRRASEALESGRKLWSIAERRPYYDRFLGYFDEELPAATLFQHVSTYALSSEVKMAEIGRVFEPRDRYRSFPEWFLLYREVSVACPEESS